MWQNGAIRVGRIGGVTVDIHLTFGLVVIWGGWQGWIQYGNLIGIVYGVAAIIFLFGCVLLHELGHAWQALRFGMVTRRVTLLPIGGVAMSESLPSTPWHELVIALSGPLTNLVMMVVFGIVAYALQPFSLQSGDWIAQLVLLPFSAPSIAGLALYLMAANLMLFAFNMLPAFPMDGGRVIRAGLAMITDYEISTRVAARLGQALAVAMGLFGAIGWPPAGIPPTPLMIVAGLIVYFGARHEELHVRRKWALVRVEVGEICQSSAESVAPWDTVTQSLMAKLFRHDRALPVVVDDRVVGLLTYQDVRRRQGSLAEAATVAHLMRTDFPVLKPSDTLWVAFREMDALQLTALPVVSDGVFHGMVSLDDIGHAWRFMLRRRRRGNPTFVSGDSIPQ